MVVIERAFDGCCCKGAARAEGGRNGEARARMVGRREACEVRARSMICKFETWGQWNKSRGGIGNTAEQRRTGESGKRTASAPCLFCMEMQRGNRVASRVATAGEGDSTARCSGVSKSALRLIPLASWPASIRNSC